MTCQKCEQCINYDWGEVTPLPRCRVYKKQVWAWTNCDNCRKFMARQITKDKYESYM